MADGIQLAIAGLLHDIGKLLQRARWGERGGARHPAFSAQFVEDFAEVFRKAGVEVEWLRDTVKRHHEGWRDAPEFQPQNPAEWCVALADSYASQEREEATLPSSSSVADTPLLSVFHQLALQGKEGERLGLSPVGRLGVGLVPGAPYPEARPNIRKEVYQRLEEKIRARMAQLGQQPPMEPKALLLSLAAILQESLSLVPADTQSEPDVSLYDHLRLTAAIAHALWLYHGGKASEAELRRDGDKFLLVVGDLGGIQGHIYRVAGAETGVGGIAKRLRARSLEVSLAAEAMALGILEGLGLTPLNRIMGAGGKFYLLLPNTEEALKHLNGLWEAWERWAFEGGASLLPHLAWEAFSGREFGRFDGVLARVHLKLSQVKLKPLHSLKGTLASLRSPLRPCAACGLRPAQKDEPGALCVGCEREREMGGRLPQAEGVAFFPAEPNPPSPFYRFPVLNVALWNGAPPSPAVPVHVQRGRPDFQPHLLPFEVKPLLGHLPTVGDALRATGQDLEAFSAWLQEEGLWEDEEVEPRRPLTFSELAALSQGVSYLGGLFLDADRMGEAFAQGFRRGQSSLATPSRIASLSRSLEWFFTVEVLELIRNPSLYGGRLGWSDLETQVKSRRYPLVYSVYSGGDDLFLLGPWDVVLELALDLERLYRLYVKHEALTLSGSFQLFAGKTPVPHMAQALQAGEARAKRDGRGRLYLFGQTVPWDTLRELRLGWVETLRRDLASERVSKAQVYRWLGIWRRHWGREGLGEAERMRYKPLLAYALRRVRERDEVAWNRYMGLLNHCQAPWQYLPVWVQWALYLERR